MRNKVIVGVSLIGLIVSLAIAQQVMNPEYRIKSVLREVSDLASTSKARAPLAAAQRADRLSRLFTEEARITRYGGTLMAQDRSEIRTAAFHAFQRQATLSVSLKGLLIEIEPSKSTARVGASAYVTGSEAGEKHSDFSEVLIQLVRREQGWIISSVDLVSPFDRPDLGIHHRPSF